MKTKLKTAKGLAILVALSIALLPVISGLAQEGQPLQQVLDSAYGARSVAVSGSAGGSPKAGDTGSLSASLSGFDGLAYSIQWQSSSGGGWSDVGGANGTGMSVTLTDGNARNAYRVKVVVTGAPGAAAGSVESLSNSVTLAPNGLTAPATPAPLPVTPVPAPQPAAETPAPVAPPPAPEQNPPVEEQAMPQEKPAPQEPAAQELKVEEPAAQEPAVEEPAAEEPAAEEPAVEEPAAEEPAAEEPVAGEPAVEEPAAEEPAAEEPAVEEPAAEEPAAEEPAAEEPVAEEPAVEEPAAEEPAAEEPAVEEPATEEPVAEEPAAEEPAPLAEKMEIPAGESEGEAHLNETIGIPIQEILDTQFPNRKITIYASWEDMSRLEIGDTITLTAVLSGYEGLAYGLRWQVAANGGDFQDVSGATDTTHSFILDEQNYYWTWRIAVDIDSLAE